MWFLWLLLTTMSSIFAQSEGRCALDVGFGLENMEITRPDSGTAVYDGYGGKLTGRYNLTASENFHLGARISLGYAELDNKANTANVTESLRNITGAPGLELRIRRVFLGVDYEYNKMTIDLSGNLSGRVNTSFYAPQFFAGVDIPMGWWELRFTYSRGVGDIPRLDTGLAQDSPWKQDQFMIAIKFNPRYNSSRVSSPRYEMPSSERDSSYTAPATDSSAQPYRPVRYYPRPSSHLGN